eukprot:scaffold202181_cov20-Prasinocladus_malaysianus.AAC.1
MHSLTTHLRSSPNKDEHQIIENNGIGATMNNKSYTNSRTTDELSPVLTVSASVVEHRTV